ncbi:MAG: hypothetical protein ACOX4I_03090 [Anaerovoracaceae bacterium]|jgi:uncharacterized alkaline shock family protein YloU
MEVYALSGKSGTGKSYQAMNLCRDKNIDSIIDDGLFIYKNEIIAGKSAKRASTKIGAVKTAMFYDDDHRDEVAEAIARMKPDSVLVIGTSDGMVKKIVKRLGLHGIDELIHIEDITTDEEREVAEKQRNREGKHVVPAPSFQLKRQFSGYFMHPVRMFRGWGFGEDNFAEKSVVRPTYSYLGNFIISDKVISDIVAMTAKKINGIVDLARTISINHSGELSVLIMVELDINMNAFTIAETLQKRCFDMIEEMTAFNVKNVDVEVQGLQ